MTSLAELVCRVELVHRIEVSGRAGGVEAADVEVDLDPVPRNSLKTSAIADVFVPWAAGYSGWLGVVTSGRQPDLRLSLGCRHRIQVPARKPSAVTAVRVDRGHRPPEEESVLGVEDRHQSVGAHRVDHGEQPCRLEQARAHVAGGEVAGGDVELPDHVRRVEPRGRSLLRGSRRARRASPYALTSLNARTHCLARKRGRRLRS